MTHSVGDEGRHRAARAAKTKSEVLENYLKGCYIGLIFSYFRLIQKTHEYFQDPDTRKRKLKITTPVQNITTSVSARRQ